MCFQSANTQNLREDYNITHDKREDYHAAPVDPQTQKATSQYTTVGGESNSSLHRFKRHHKSEIETQMDSLG